VTYSQPERFLESQRYKRLRDNLQQQRRYAAMRNSASGTGRTFFLSLKRSSMNLLSEPPDETGSSNISFSALEFRKTQTCNADLYHFLVP
jgi:hypothetical protein